MALVRTRNSVERVDKKTASHSQSSVLFHFLSHALVGVSISCFETTDVSVKYLNLPFLVP